MKNIGQKFRHIKYAIPTLLLVFLAAGCGQPSATQTYYPQASDQTSPSSTIIQAPPPVENPVGISSLSLPSGPVNSVVTITGYGFTPIGNLIAFGDFGGRYHKDGTPDNVIATASSTDGTTLVFTVPASGPSGILCDSQNHCAAISAVRRAPGNYNVSVTNPNGSSNLMVFTIK